MARSTLSGSRRTMLLLGVVVAALAFPLGVLASHQFADVPDSNIFHDDIAAVADTGVTTGCGGGNYCPKQNVTREQMAAFMNRLGALGPGKTPVVNARTSQSTDGWSIGCPSGTTLGGGYCFDNATRGSGNVFDASVACANLGSNILFGRGQVWQLAPALALRAADLNGDINITAQEWSSSAYFDNVIDQYRSLAYNGAGSIVDHVTLDILPYRCAALPLQIDNFIIIPLDQPKDGTAVEKAPAKSEVNADGSLKK